MRIDVRLFAVLRDRAGVDRLSLQLPESATVADARSAVAGLFPQLGPLLPRIAFAVNRSYAAVDIELHDGDELALIPPVSGG